jgi:transposase InsO family protein
MTDQARNYTLSREFAMALADLDVAHLITRPYRPQTNGKIERFNRTMLGEWAYVRLYRSNTARIDALARWVETSDGGPVDSNRWRTWARLFGSA